METFFAWPYLGLPQDLYVLTPKLAFIQHLRFFRLVRKMLRAYQASNI